MSEIIRICDSCCLEKDMMCGNGTVNLIYNENEPENCATLTSHELDKLATETNIGKRMIEYINIHNTILPCGTELMRQQLLDDIEELEATDG